MKVFLTGASGFVGSAVAKELLRSGHQVTGLARSAESERVLTSEGVSALRGDLNDLDSIRRGVRDADGVIHCGFVHDFTRFKESCELDHQVLLAMGEELRGSSRPLVVTSGVGIFGSGVVDETQRPPASATNPRKLTETAVDRLLDLGVNASLMRLPPSTHGAGDHGFVPMLIAMARAKGQSAYIGDGSNTWPAVHRFDAARAYRLALERAEPGSRYHAVAEKGLTFRSIAEEIGRGLALPVRSVSGDATSAHFGGFAHFALMNVTSDAALTRSTLGWTPTGPTLFEDMASTDYFAAR